MRILHRTIVSYSHLRIVINVCKPKQNPHISFFSNINWKENWNTLISASLFLEVATSKYDSDPEKFYLVVVLHGKDCAIKAKLCMRKRSIWLVDKSFFFYI